MRTLEPHHPQIGVCAPDIPHQDELFKRVLLETFQMLMKIVLQNNTSFNYLKNAL